MHRKFIAMICASALAVTAFTAPARADDDVAKMIAGLAVLAIIGAAINDHNDNDTVVVQRRAQPYYPPQNHGHSYSVRPPQVVQPKPLPRQITRYDLPRSCLKTVRRGRDEFKILGGNCLQNNYRLTDSLPKACKVQVQGNKGTRAGYKPHCLRERGYNLSRK